MAFNVFFLLYFGLRVSWSNTAQCDNGGASLVPRGHTPPASALAGRQSPVFPGETADLCSDFLSVRGLSSAHNFLKYMLIVFTGGEIGIRITNIPPLADFLSLPSIQTGGHCSLNRTKKRKKLFDLKFVFMHPHLAQSWENSGIRG